MSRGVLAGLDRSLRELYRAFKPGIEGIDHIRDEAIIVLPVELPFATGWVEQGTSPSVPIGSTTRVVLATVPVNARWFLFTIGVDRASGDNLINRLDWTLPVGYGIGTRRGQVMGPSLGGSTFYTPFAQAANVAFSASYGGFPLEPGTEIGLTPTGNGAAASTFDFAISVIRSTQVRVTAPS